MKRNYGYNTSKQLINDIKIIIEQTITECYYNIKNGLEKKANENYNTLKKLYYLKNKYKIKIDNIEMIVIIEENYGLL